MRLAKLRNRLRLLIWKIRVHDPDDIEAEVLTDDVGEQALCIKVREGRAYDVLVLDREDAEGVIDMVLKEMRAHGWTRLRRVNLLYPAFPMVNHDHRTHILHGGGRGAYAGRPLADGPDGDALLH